MSTGRAHKQTVVLIAEDDDDHYFLMKKAFSDSGYRADLRNVKDGEELMDYLLHKNAYASASEAPRPDAILLDINMPKKNGLEALGELKSYAELRSIPVIVLTTSRREEDKKKSYELGASSYIRKPIEFNELLRVVQTLNEYWFGTVELTGQSEEQHGK